VTPRFEESLEFYTRLIGLQLWAADVSKDYAILRGTVGTGDLTIYRQRPGLEAGFHHVGFEAWDEADLERSIAGLASRGLEAERIVDHSARRAVTIRDPDGLRLQFFVNRQWTPQAANAVDAATALYLF
jgi:catechol 2,3-dioxygenase